MLGQDICTQEEFDEFTNTQFLPAINTLHKEKLAVADFEVFSNKINKDINKLSFIIATATLINIAVLFFIVVTK